MGGKAEGPIAAVVGTAAARKHTSPAPPQSCPRLPPTWQIAQVGAASLRADTTFSGCAAPPPSPTAAAAAGAEGPAPSLVVGTGAWPMAAAGRGMRASGLGLARLASWPACSSTKGTHGSMHRVLLKPNQPCWTAATLCGLQHCTIPSQHLVQHNRNRSSGSATLPPALTSSPCRRLVGEASSRSTTSAAAAPPPALPAAQLPPASRWLVGTKSGESAVRSTTSSSAAWGSCTCTVGACRCGAAAAAAAMACAGAGCCCCCGAEPCCDAT